MQIKRTAQEPDWHARVTVKRKLTHYSKRPLPLGPDIGSEKYVFSRSPTYKAWWYETRPETPNATDPSAQTLPACPRPESRLCANLLCKKGQDDARGLVRNPRAKYCCPSCRVAVCRRNRREANPEPANQPKRKPRSDKKYGSPAARQRAYEGRKRDREGLSHVSIWDLADRM
jgi:hypothetical protein